MLALSNGPLSFLGPALFVVVRQPGAHLVDLRDLLARQVLRRDQAVTEAILLTVLEHLFTDPDVVAFFADWKAHSDLAAGTSLVRILWPTLECC